MSADSMVLAATGAIPQTKPDPAAKAPAPTPAEKPAPPLQGLAPAELPETRSLAEAAERLNQAMQDSRRDLRFSVDQDSGRTVIQVVNPGSGEVVRQIPSEEMLALATKLMAGDVLTSLGVEYWS